MSPIAERKSKLAYTTGYWNAGGLVHSMMSRGVLAKMLSDRSRVRRGAVSFSSGQQRDEGLDSQGLEREQTQLDELGELKEDEEPSHRQEEQPVGRLSDVGGLDLVGQVCSKRERTSQFESSDKSIHTGWSMRTYRRIP